MNIPEGRIRIDLFIRGDRLAVKYHDPADEKETIQSFEEFLNENPKYRTNVRARGWLVLNKGLAQDLWELMNGWNIEGLVDDALEEEEDDADDS